LVYCYACKDTIAPSFVVLAPFKTSTSELNVAISAVFLSAYAFKATKPIASSLTEAFNKFTSVCNPIVSVCTFPILVLLVLIKVSSSPTLITNASKSSPNLVSAACKAVIAASFF
jgi:hypothetical protein